jgi:hypothetical protein
MFRKTGGAPVVSPDPVLAPSPNSGVFGGAFQQAIAKQNALNDLAKTPAPTAPDSTLASSNAALAALVSANRARNRAMGAGTMLTGTPGAATPNAIIRPTMLGGAR